MLSVTGDRHFPEFIPEFNGAMLSVVDDVPIDNKTPVVIS
jgi:hypothetical protein